MRRLGGDGVRRPGAIMGAESPERAATATAALATAAVPAPAVTPGWARPASEGRRPQQRDEQNGRQLSTAEGR